MANLGCGLDCHLAEAICGPSKSKHLSIAEGKITRAINLKKTRFGRTPAVHPRFSCAKSPEQIGSRLTQRTTWTRGAYRAKLGRGGFPATRRFQIHSRVFENKLIGRADNDPLFRYDCPKGSWCPMASKKRRNITCRCLRSNCINGRDLAPGLQRALTILCNVRGLLGQAGERKQQKIEQGISARPRARHATAGGFGLGIDRLTMIARPGAESIPDVILFFHLRPKQISGRGVNRTGR